MTPGNPCSSLHASIGIDIPSSPQLSGFHSAVFPIVIPLFWNEGKADGCPISARPACLPGMNH
jgi:hypothetical protein